MSTRLWDPDVWQHLVVGGYFWDTLNIPRIHLWSWPLHGQSDVTPSWLFRVVLWPFWNSAGVTGLFLFRWSIALATFGGLYLFARRLGAGVLPTLVVLSVCALTYRGRSQVRPEMLAGILLVLVLLILEQSRQRGRRVLWALPVVIAVWVNIHISYYLGIVAIVAYSLDAFVHSSPRKPTFLAVAALVLACTLAVLINPFGWRLPWQPFEYLLHLRHEPIFRTIRELQPLSFPPYWPNYLPVLLVLWPVLAVVRAFRRRPDWAELVLCAVSVAQAVQSGRFGGTFVILAAPFLARGVSQFPIVRDLDRRNWSWMVVGASCVILSIPEWIQPGQPLGVGLSQRAYPVAACNFVESTGIRGRLFNHFGLSGYVLHRFWPDTTRLPFMDIHQTATREDRRLYITAQLDPNEWNYLDRKYEFDYVLLHRLHENIRTLPDFLDEDPAWSFVFSDDIALLYVRRARFPSVTERHGYKFMRGSDLGLREALTEAWRDTNVRRGLLAEALREASRSDANSQAHLLVGTLFAMDARVADAREEFRAALRTDQTVPQAHMNLARLALAEGNPNLAMMELALERRLGKFPGYEFLRGVIFSAQGRRKDAMRSYQRALDENPMDKAARDSLTAMRSAP